MHYYDTLEGESHCVSSMKASSKSVEVRDEVNYNLNKTIHVNIKVKSLLGCRLVEFQ